jgi:hypothetical protein
MAEIVFGATNMPLKGMVQFLLERNLLTGIIPVVRIRVYEH